MKKHKSKVEKLGKAIDKLVNGDEATDHGIQSLMTLVEVTSKKHEELNHWAARFGIIDERKGKKRARKE